MENKAVPKRIALEYQEIKLMAVEPTKTTKIMLFVGHWIPLFVRKGLFISLFKLFYHLGTKNRLITLHNLMRSFPEKDLKQIIGISKGV
jgi:lauroyl/myristoyl acyltransferase